MKKLMNHILLGLCLLISSTAQAADGSMPEKNLEPDLPPRIESGEALSPDITILRKGKKIITQYRVNGELYMVKIKPDVGPSYYLIDSNGDGNMNVRRNDLERDMQIPQWVLFSW